MALEYGLRQSSEIDLQRENYSIVFSGPGCEMIVDSIIESYGKFFRKGEISWDKFEDGFPNLFIRNVESVRGRDVVFIASFLNQMELLSQLSVLYTLPRYLVRSLIVALPYFPTGTMERVDEEGQIATAMTFARLLSSVPLTLSGPTKLLIYDIHALQNRFYFSDSVIPLLVSAIPLFLEILLLRFSKEKIVIAFPDDGATKRFGKKFNRYPVVTCIKVRVEDKRIVKIKEGAEHLTDAHVFIVDDLVKTGGTLIECKNALLAAGASKVSAYVTHPVFPQESWKKFIEAKPDQFSHFFVTDSCPEIASILKDKNPFEIIPLASSIATNILKY
eukprot:TRINITY_DN7972_c0_g1_i1.p1 TRINITY_DN7972_c0_g1~~TRINITY_DN7972_c0_g1_i1.p1  ORF type:complete len:348 (+),score=89.91 TRINITY_DN7972_c0_g1_i1:50-1045(+)